MSKREIILVTWLLALGLILIILRLDKSYTNQTITEIQNLKQPLVLKDKSKMTFRYSIIIMDKDQNIHSYGNSSDLANEIGKKYNINDTIKLNKLTTWN